MLSRSFPRERRRRLENHGLRAVLETFTTLHIRDADGYRHVTSRCQGAYGVSTVVHEPLNWYELHCECWAHRPGHDPNVDDLLTVEQTLHVEELVSAAEANPEDIFAQQAIDGLLWEPSEMHEPAREAAHSTWVRDLHQRLQVRQAEWKSAGLPAAREAVARKVAVRHTERLLEEVYATTKWSLAERRATRELLGLWSEQTLRGEKDVRRRLLKLVGRCAQSHSISPAKLGYWTKMWLQDAERVLLAKTREVLEGPWEAVIYSVSQLDISAGIRGRRNPWVAPFVVAESQYQVLVALPRAVRRELGKQGLAQIRCQEFPGGNDEAVREVLATLWERDTLHTDGKLEQLISAAGLLR